MVERSLLNTEVFVFILVVVITVIVLAVYRIFRPELQLPYNFSPFPNVSPKDLPDASTTGGNCSTTLTPCDALGACSKCGEEDYECTQVIDSNRYVFKNMKVPLGNWCLPKQNPDQTCNTYTGRWTWSNDSDYCQRVNGKNQCWKCLCLYPDLFDGPETGCTTQKACKNNEIPKKGVDQNNNHLVGMPGTKYDGKVWDPHLGDTDVLLTSPYTVDDSTNKPMFQCKCDTETIIPFVKLPHDPYTCHIDPCFKYDNYRHPGAKCSESDCECNCDTVSGSIKAPWGDYKGTCLQESDVCKNGTWDKTTQNCNCPGGISVDCKSNHVPDSTGPDCADNPLGRQCVYPCTPNRCQNGGVCSVVKSGQACASGYESCPVPGVSGVSTCCQCPTEDVYSYNGNCCSNKCIVNGTVKNETCVDSSGRSHDSVFYTGNCCNGSHVESSGGFLSCQSTVCGPDHSGSSCFVIGTKVVMADGSLKNIEKISAGEKVRSVRTGKATRVLFLDKEYLGSRRLIGVNGGKPFATEDHCFLGLNGKRTISNVALGTKSNHWDEAQSLEQGSELQKWNGQNLCPFLVHSVNFESRHWNLPVYDILTEDHSYIAGGFAVYDDVPELEKHLSVSLTILSLLRICEDNQLHLTLAPKKDAKSWKKIQEFSAKLYEKHHREAIKLAKKVDMNAPDVVPVFFGKFIELISKDERLVNVGSSLWRQFMPKLKEQLE